MRRIDFYVQHLVRHNAREVELASGKPVRFGFPSGSRNSNNSLDHRQLMQLIEEAAPPEALASLKRDKQSGVSPRRRRESRSTFECRCSPTTRSRSFSYRTTASPLRPQAPATAAAATTRNVRATARRSDGRSSGGKSRPRESRQRERRRSNRLRHAPRAKRESIPVPRVEHVPGEPEVNRVLREMVQLGASDLHLSSTVSPMVRLDGEMKVLEGRSPLVPEELERMLMEICPEAKYRRVQRDERHRLRSCDRRGSALPRQLLHGPKRNRCAVFRQIPFKILTVADLNLPQGVVDLCWLSKGLVVVTGPDRKWEVDDVGRTRRLHQRKQVRPPHYDRGSGRVRARQQEVLW